MRTASPPGVWETALTPMRVPVLVLAAAFAGLFALAAPVCAQDEPAVDLSGFLAELESALMADGPAAYAALVGSPTTRDATPQELTDEMFLPGATRVTVRERDRTDLAGALAGEGFRLIVDILSERGRGARIATWRLDVRLARRGDARLWRIVDQERLSRLDGLYELALSPTEYNVRNLLIESTDLRLSMSSGHAFVAKTDEGVTALVLRGRGEMIFTPQPVAEKTQLRIFSKAEALVTAFDMALLRFSPAAFRQHVEEGALTERPADEGDLRRAREFFQENVVKSFTLDLGDLSSRTWSLSPSGDDLLAEIHTKRFDTLTYARSENEAEDVSLFDRAKRRYISSYASPEKLETRGRFYDEDDMVDYDVLDYRLNVRFDPERNWIDGIETLSLRVKAPLVSTLTLRLDERLDVRAVSSPDFGRLMHLRVLGQNNLIVNLPAGVLQGTELELTVSYAGRLPPQSLERETIGVDQDTQLPQVVEIAVPPEPHWVYSNGAYWYPQSTVSDYATATMRITVPDGYDCVASGLQAVGSPIRVEPKGGGKALKIYVFIAGRPVRYLGCAISRFVDVASGALTPAASGARDGGADTPVAGLTLTVVSNPRQDGRSRTLRETAADILRFYASLMGDAPYPGFTLAVTESQVPGGHSPAYFAVLDQPLPTSPFTWRNDPVNFNSFPSFFLAHEIAHQWWGQGVGWENYHEQWLSEGLAQYFALLYAEHARGPQLESSMLRQMRTWSLRYADQGPIYLGYRLGHVQGRHQIFRALVYNKSAEVLHMLRRLIGDDAFFDGLRRFYEEHKYQKAGTDDLRRAMEATSGVPLQRFFDQWIDGVAIPRLRFSSRERATPGGSSVTLRFEQQGEIFDVPVTVTLIGRSGERRDVLVKVTEAVTEVTVPIDFKLRDIDVNDDNAALAEIDR